MIGGFLPILFQLFLLYTMSVTVLIDGSIKGNGEVCEAGARRERELDARERESLARGLIEFPVLFKTTISYQLMYSFSSF